MCHIWGRSASENIWRDIVWALNFTHLISLIAETHLLDKKSMTKRPSALGNKCFLFYMLIMLFVSSLKVPLVNAKNVQLRRKRENFCSFA